jgi:hypothetical protein
MPQRTTFLSRLIGLYAILTALAMMSHKQASVEMVTGLMHNPPLLFMAGLMALITGLAIILSHNVWSGGALPIVVTLIGWASLIKGLLLLFPLPEVADRMFLGALHYEQFFYLYTSITLLLGIYLTSMGMLGRKSASCAGPFTTVLHCCRARRPGL